jgi:trans-aconitate methyltransferase
MAEIARDRFSGFSKLYDNVRPVPPEKVCAILLNLLNKQKVATVVDLGCGTGLSTSMWKHYAENVIGLEPNDDMRQLAIEKNPDIAFGKNRIPPLKSNVESLPGKASFHRPDSDNASIKR